MKKLIHTIFLVTGTSIGSGLISLPMSAVNLGLLPFLCMVLVTILIVYQSCRMTAQLIATHKMPVSIVELSRQYGGKFLFAVTLSSFYLLSFGVLTVYFSCMADTVGTFCGLSKTVSIVLCGFCLWALLNLRTRLFSDLNSVFVITLLGVVAVAIFSIKKIPESTSAEMHFRAIEWIHMVPIIFTAFGVQGSCAYFCSYLNNDLKRLKTAFLIGLAIPAVIYFLWTLCCLKTAMAYDTEFFRRLQEHQVSVGELIRFLCESSSVPAMRTFLKLLTILGVLTSIIGVALGLMQPLRSVLPKILTKPTLCFVPVIINLTLAEAFLKVLSFGGMMLAIFAILVPYQLLKPMGVQKTFAYRLCFIGGITVVACELWSVFG